MRKASIECSPLIDSSVGTNAGKFAQNRAFQFAEDSLSEIRIIALLFFRIAMQNISGQFPLLICTFFIGHLPNAPLLIAGSGLAVAFTEVTGTAFSLGMSSALNTLVPQTIAAQQKQLIAVYFQRSLVVCLPILCIISLLEYYGGYIMCALGQPSEICGIVSHYCQVLIVYIWSFLFVNVLSRIVQSLSFNTDLFVSTSVCAALSVPLNVLFVYILEYGYIGTAYTIALCTLLSAVWTFAILIYRGYSFIFVPLSFRVIFTFKGIFNEYLGLSIPVLFQVALPFWFYDLCLILSGYIYDPQITLSAGTIIGSMLVLIALIYEGLYLTLTMRVGFYLGIGNLKFAKRSVICSFVVWAVFSIFLAIILIVFKNEIPYLYTNNSETARAVTDCTYIIVVRVVCYGMYITITGVYLALGYPHYPAAVMFICMWLLTFSAIIVLLYADGLKRDTMDGMFVIWGIPAVLGYGLGSVVLALGLLCKIDWNKAMIESKTRIERNVKDYNTFKSDKPIQKMIAEGIFPQSSVRKTNIN